MSGKKPAPKPAAKKPPMPALPPMDMLGVGSGGPPPGGMPGMPPPPGPSGFATRPPTGMRPKTGKMAGKKRGR